MLGEGAIDPVHAQATLDAVREMVAASSWVLRAPSATEEDSHNEEEGSRGEACCSLTGTV